MNPFIPHFSSECLSFIDESQISWPSVSKDDLIEEEIIFVVQINGKKRAILKVNRDITEYQVLEKIKTNKEIQKNFEGQKIKRSIFIPNKLINIII